VSNVKLELGFVDMNVDSKSVALSILDVVCSSLIYNGIPVHFEIQPE
jgi:hypothetical protein